jgi:KDEL-tailed cysteine endopeptidase
MFTFLLLVVFLSNVFAKNGLRGLSLIDPEIEWKEFSNFIQRFKKTYETMDEFHSRFEVFRQNIRMIVAHNLDSTQNFTMGVNQFADLTPDEFKSMISRFSVQGPIAGYGCKAFTSSASGAPASLDWRTKGAVTSVKDQGQCGSCWTFSATGAIEGAWALAKGQLVNFSEQELVDCATGISYGSHGCNGGQMDGAFKFVIENGQCTDAAYPYTSGVTKTGGACQKCTATAHITSCSDVKPNDQVSLKGAVAKQPVAIALSADTKVFQF